LVSSLGSFLATLRLHQLGVGFRGILFVHFKHFKGVSSEDANFLDDELSYERPKSIALSLRDLAAICL
jgi:hypothetical protein